MGASSDLQVLIVARLKAAVPMVAGRVYDAPKEGVAWPYISIGASYTVLDDADCIDARNETIQIDVWADRKPDLTACKDVTDQVVAAFRRWSPDPKSGVIDASVTLFRVMEDPNPGVAHGVVQIEVMVEED